jgi:Tol biopolymer transport system component
MNKVLWLILALLLGACALSQALESPASQPPAPPAANTSAPGGIAALSTSQLAGMNLAGRLVLIQYDPGGNILIELSLPGGEVTTLFQSPEKSWLAAASVSPDGEQILLSYALPPAAGQVQLGTTDLYRLPYDASAPPQPLLERGSPEESYFNPTWSPDGRYVYYSHFSSINPDTAEYRYNVERMQFAGGTEVIVQDGIWPRLAPNGEKLAYLSVDPIGVENHLYTARPDGTSPARVMQTEDALTVDAHLFLPDSQTILFSAVNPQPKPSGSWLDRLLGVTTASAHNVPSDWYQVILPGGEPQRLTRLNDTGMFADVSPGGDRIVFISATGLYIMNLDGSDLVQISSQVFTGTVDWIE